mgnify:CR=1 FL=1
MHKSLLHEQPPPPTVEEDVRALRRRVDESETLIVGHIDRLESRLEGLLRSLLLHSFVAPIVTARLSLPLASPP